MTGTPEKTPLPKTAGQAAKAARMAALANGCAYDPEALRVYWEAMTGAERDAEEIGAEAAIDWWHAERDLEPPQELTVAGPLEQEIADLRAQLAGQAERLKAAETYCTLSGWQGARMATDEEKALLQLWLDWHHLPGVDADPSAHPELSAERIAELARKRDEIRTRTLAAIREQHPDLIARTEIARTETEAGQQS